MMSSSWKIAFLDRATVDLGDLDLTPITRQGRLVSLERCARGKFPKAIRSAEVLITNKVVLGAKEIPLFPRLRLICVAATGVNNIDLQAAKKSGVAVCNVAGYSTPTVVEHTLMFLLALAHRLPEHHQAVLKGEWSRAKDFALFKFPYSDLRGKKLGILGYGNLGRQVARIARALEMEVLVGKVPGRKYSKSRHRVELKALLKNSDYVSVHCPLTPKTRGMMDFKKIKSMKPTAYLLNLARGPIVVETDVARALEKNLLAGYAADVTCQEPIPKGHPFLKKSLASKVLLTPHIAWASRESRQRLVNEIGANIAAFKMGKRRNRIV